MTEQTDVISKVCHVNAFIFKCDATASEPSGTKLSTEAVDYGGSSLTVIRVKEATSLLICVSALLHCLIKLKGLFCACSLPMWRYNRPTLLSKLTAPAILFLFMFF